MKLKYKIFLQWSTKYFHQKSSEFLSNFMNEVYNGEYAPEFRNSVLKEIIVLVSDHEYKTRK